MKQQEELAATLQDLESMNMFTRCVQGLSAIENNGGAGTTQVLAQMEREETVKGEGNTAKKVFSWIKSNIFGAK